MKRTDLARVLHVYTRVSTVAQEDKGTSLASQEKLGRERAAKLGFAIEVWNEGGKSSNHEEISGRPKLQALVNEITLGRAKHIFVYDQSRLSRNDNVASLIRYQFKKHGVTLHTKDGTYDFTNASDTFMKQVLDAMAEFDNAGRVERTRLGKLSRVKQNQWHGGPPPFGYKLQDKRLAVEPKEAEKVKDIFQRYASGESVLSLKKALDKGSVLPRRGGAWTTGSILKILSNTHYIGYYLFRDKKSEDEVRVTCPPIVPASTWQKAQAQRKAVLLRKGQVNRTTHFYLLRDFMFCGHCGTPLGARTKAKKHEHFYYCPSKERRWKEGVQSTKKHSKRDGCGFSRSMNIPMADSLVWNVVVDVHSKSSLLKEEVKRRLMGGFVAPADGSDKRDEKAIKAAAKELERADEAIVELDVERRLGQGDAKQHDLIMKRLREQRNAIEARLDSLQADVKNKAEERKWVDWVKAFGDEVKLKSKLTAQDRKDYLSGMIDRIDVKFFPDSKQHQLDIHFRRPIVGDGIVLKKPKGYRLREGAASKIALLKGGGGVKRMTPVGKHSVTVE